MESFELEIATPRRPVLTATVRQAEIPTVNGDVGVLPGHAPLLAALGTGVLTWEAADGSRGRLVVSGGFLEVLQQKATVLADLAEFPNEVNATTAQSDLEAAERETHLTEPEGGADAARQRLQLAQARLQVTR